MGLEKPNLGKVDALNDSKKTTQSAYQTNINTSIQSQITGDAVLIKAGGDINITGSDVLANRDIDLVSDGKIHISSAANIKMAIIKNIIIILIMVNFMKYKLKMVFYLQNQYKIC